MATKTRADIDNMSARDRLWDSLEYTYGKKRENSDKSFAKQISQQDRTMLGRGMQRSSYGAQTMANLRKEAVRASNDIYDEQIADYENRIYQIERDEKSDEQWQKQFDESQRQFNENMGFQKSESARQQGNWEKEFAETQKQNATQNSQWQQTFNYQQGRDAVADEQWQKTFNYQQERDTVSDQHWQAEFDEGVRQFNVQHDQSSSGGGGGGGGSSGPSGSSDTTGIKKVDTSKLNRMAGEQISSQAFGGLVSSISTAINTPDSKKTQKKATAGAVAGALGSAVSTKKK